VVLSGVLTGGSKLALHGLCGVLNRASVANLPRLSLKWCVPDYRTSYTRGFSFDVVFVAQSRSGTPCRRFTKDAVSRRPTEKKAHFHQKGSGLQSFDKAAISTGE
jgi:hypothetical protein